MPFALTRRYGLVVMRQAPLCTYGGYWLSTKALGGSETKPERLRGNRHSLISKLVKQLPKTFSNRWRLHPDLYLDGLPWYNHGYKIYTYYTYRLQLQQASDIMWQNLRHHLRSDIRRAQNKLTVIAADFDWHRHAPLIRYRYRKQNIQLPIAKETLERLHKTGLLRCFEACQPETNQLAGVIVWATDDHEATLLLQGMEPGASSAMPLQLLIWHSLKSHSDEGLHFADLEGSMLPNVEHQIRAWGGQWTPYLVVERIQPVHIWRSFLGRY